MSKPMVVIVPIMALLPTHRRRLSQVGGGEPSTTSKAERLLSGKHAGKLPSFGDAKTGSRQVVEATVWRPAADKRACHFRLVSHDQAASLWRER
jgi:hypothetical protein